MTTAAGIHHLEVYQRRRQELLGLAHEQRKIAATLSAAPEPSSPSLVDALDQLIGRLESDQLRVLVVGRFNAGKSTLLNALLGARLLPASPAPTTGVLCVIRHADEEHKRALLHPRPGIPANRSDAPFEIPTENLHDELSKYVKIDHFGGSEVTSRFRLVEVYWPLPLCERGIELTDSVGLDDPESRDTITLDYARSTDAVLYCMASGNAYAAKDRDTLELFQSLGYRSIFFVITHWDLVAQAAARGETPEAEFRRYLINCLAQWTELGEDGIRCVDSLAALRGRMLGNPELVRSAGIEELEAALATFLAEERGRAKLVTSLRALQSLNQRSGALIAPQIAMWQTSVSELERRYQDAQGPFQLLAMARRSMVSTVEAEIRDIGRVSRDLAEAYLLDLPNKLATWADAYEIERGLGFPPRRSTLEPVIKEVMDHLKQKIDSDMAAWCTSTLSSMVESRVNGLEKSLEAKAQDFVRRVDELRIQVTLADQIPAPRAPGLPAPTALGRLLGVGFTLLTGDFVTGGLGVVLGPRAMLSTIMVQVVGGFLLGLLGLFNPVTFIALVIASILRGVFRNASALKRKLKDSVAKGIADAIGERRSEIGKMLQDKVEDQLKPLRDALDAGLVAELDGTRQQVERHLAAHRTGRADADREIAELRRHGRDNDALAERIDALMFEAGMQPPRQSVA